MENLDGSISVTLPSVEEARVAFEAYTNALGRATYAWNFLLERLAALFAVVVDADRAVTLAVWYAVNDDRTKISMLKAAVDALPHTKWPAQPTSLADLAWLAERAKDLADARNNAVHGPTTLLGTPDGHEMAAHPLSGHVRAKNLRGKDLLVEFDWLERWAEELSRYTMSLISALHPSALYTWPDKPEKPARRRKSDLKGPRRGEGIGIPSPPHSAS
jgi:hypothetical protein